VEVGLNKEKQEIDKIKSDYVKKENQLNLRERRLDVLKRDLLSKK
jgi:hypothetical protein